jgi:hypothetical protein
MRQEPGLYTSMVLVIRPDILPEAGVLLGFAVIFFSVGVMRFRYE